MDELAIFCWIYPSHPNVRTPCAAFECELDAIAYASLKFGVFYRIEKHPVSFYERQNWPECPKKPS